MRDVFRLIYYNNDTFIRILQLGSDYQWLPFSKNAGDRNLSPNRSSNIILYLHLFDAFSFRLERYRYRRVDWNDLSLLYLWGNKNFSEPINYFILLKEKRFASKINLSVTQKITEARPNWVLLYCTPKRSFCWDIPRYAKNHSAYEISP